MIRNRKETAWKKSRKFGDIRGGRVRIKLTDNIFKRYHSIERPHSDDLLPKYFLDNPSKDFFFPITVNEIEEFLEKLPISEKSLITHIWLRKIKRKDFEKGETYQACFISGSGVRLIILNAFPKNLKMNFGKKKPSERTKKFFSQWKNEWKNENGLWFLKWTKKGIKQYYLEYLLLHEIGHLVESRLSKYYSKKSERRREDFTDNFAMIWAAKVKKEVSIKD